MRNDAYSQSAAASARLPQRPWPAWGSIKLAIRDSELVTRLSDLSGSLSSGLQIEPYLTSYPLPNGEFHAIARTWPDAQAARAGCVLTHTILIPQEAWGVFKKVRSIDRYFRNPLLHPAYLFTDSIEIDAENEALASLGDVKVNAAATRAFVSRYFGQGVRPIVWFNAEKPEEYFWRLMEHLWPRLRTAFSCCTFSLQLRQLQDRPFDLLFAPAGCIPALPSSRLTTWLMRARTENSRALRQSPGVNSGQMLSFRTGQAFPPAKMNCRYGMNWGKIRALPGNCPWSTSCAFGPLSLRRRALARSTWWNPSRANHRQQSH